MKFFLTSLGVCSIVVCAAVFILLVYYMLAPYYNKCKWEFKKSENIKSIIIPVGKELGKEIFREATMELNHEMKTRISGNPNRMKSITTSTGPDGICYITVWYTSKDYSYPEVKSGDIDGFKI